MSDKGFCKSCGREILWVQLDTGRRMPVDLDSKETKVAVREGVGRVVTMYGSHFATCPQADAHRGMSVAERLAARDKAKQEGEG